MNPTWQQNIIIEYDRTIHLSMNFNMNNIHPNLKT